MPNHSNTMYRSLSLLLVLMLASCVTPLETRITSNGEKGAQFAEYQLGAAIRPADGLSAQKSVIANLAQRGIKQAEIAPVRLDVTFSALSAALKLNSGESSAVASAAKVHVPRSSKKCEPLDYRLGVTFTDIRSGTIVYRASAAEYHCKAAVDPIIASLSSAVLADIGTPKGGYVITRDNKR
jgi:hypothetical protein